MCHPLLEVRDLQVHFFTPNGVVKAVNGVSFSIQSGEILALVGESGSGKSITALSIMSLVPRPNGKLIDGKVMFEGRDLTDLKEKEMRKIRGREIAIIFQNPLTSLDPFFTIGNQMVETICYRQGLSRKKAWIEAKNLLDLVGIQNPERVLNSYPHALSGGMRQRVMIAMALSCKPKLLIADEPTTALDATIQKQILSLLKKINKEFNTAILMITHDFGVVASICDSVAVMYAGRIVETGTTDEILSKPEHPYTKGLIGALPDNVSRGEFYKRKRLPQINGFPPNLLQMPQGCSFVERCPEARKICWEKFPDITHLKYKHAVRCFNREEIAYGRSDRS